MSDVFRPFVIMVVGVAVGLVVTAVDAADLGYTGSHYDVGDNGQGKYFPKYDYKQCCVVPWRSDDSGNVFSARHTATGRYYGVDGWALFGTHFDFPDANSLNTNHDYLTVNDPLLPNLEELPYFVENSQILAHHKAGGDAAALIDDPRTQWGGRWWTFDGTNYPPPDGTNITGVVPYLKTGFLHGWDEFGHDPATGPAGRYAFVVNGSAPQRFRVGVMTDGLADRNRAPEEVYLFQMDPTDVYFNTVLQSTSTGSIPVGSDTVDGTNRFIDMHFFDVVDAQSGDLFVIAARAYAGEVYAGVNGISFDVIKDPGDYNADGVVDAADYTVWRDSVGQGVKAGARADGDNSSEIDAGDYLVWKSNFGNVTPGSGGGFGSVGVPEPAAGLLALGVLFSGMLTRLGRWPERSEEILVPCSI